MFIIERDMDSITEKKTVKINEICFICYTTVHVRNKQTHTATNIHHKIMRIEHDNCLTCSI